MSADKRTRYIVSGFIRNVEQSLQATHRKRNSYYTIASTISFIIISYVSDHFTVDRGIFEWKIADKQTLNEIKNCRRGYKLYSDVFKIAKLSWKCILLPNGWNRNTIGSFGIFVTSHSIPPSWQHITIIRTIQCPQFNSSQTAIDIYENGTSKGWRAGTLSFNEIKTSVFNHLTIIIKIQIIQIKLKRNKEIYYNFRLKYDYNQSFEWSLNHEIIEKLKSASIGKIITSKIYNSMWAVSLCPNNDSEGSVRSDADCKVYLVLCALPQQVSAIDVEWSVNDTVNNININNKSDFDYDKSMDCCCIATFEEFQTFDSLDLNVQIRIVKEYDYDDNEIEAASREWDRYIMQDRDNETVQQTVGSKQLQICTQEIHNLQMRMNRQFYVYDEKIDKLKSDIQKITDVLHKFVKSNAVNH